MESELSLADIGFYHQTDVMLEGSKPMFSEGFLDHIAGSLVATRMVFFVLLKVI